MTTLTASAPSWQQFRETFPDVAMSIEDDWWKETDGPEMFYEYDRDADSQVYEERVALAACVFLKHKLAYMAHCRRRMEAWLERNASRWEEAKP